MKPAGLFTASSPCYLRSTHQSIEPAGANHPPSAGHVSIGVRPGCRRAFAQLLTAASLLLAGCSGFGPFPPDPFPPPLVQELPMESGTLFSPCAGPQLRPEAPSVSPYNPRFALEVFKRSRASLASLHPRTWPGTRQLGTASTDKAHGVAADSKGNVYVTGETNGGLDSNTNAGFGDLFVVKYDDCGLRRWTRQRGTAKRDFATGVAVDGSGNVYVTGATESSLDGNTHVGDYDLFLIKYDAAGNWQWTRQLGTPNSDVATGIAVDGRGYIYIAGQTDGGLDGNTNAGSTDLFLVKYDAAGVKQ